MDTQTPFLERLQAVEKRISYKFKNMELLLEALSHSSYVNENPNCGRRCNERMELLGDSVLGLIVTLHLYQQYPDHGEGKLTLMKSVLVSEDTLARIARKMDLGSALFLGKGEDSSGGRTRKSNLSNAIEALLAAVFLDGGPADASAVAHRLFRDEFEKIDSRIHSLNYKNLLQNYSQEEEGLIPEYTLIASRGPQHGKLFEVGVSIRGKTLGRGAGKTKKQAEQEAAESALVSLGILEKEKK